MSPRIVAIIVFLGAASISRGGAESLFPEKAHDFGPSPRGPMLVHHFRFTNEGKEPVLIARVRATCTCLKAEAPAQKIKPGESASIAVHMDTRRFAGPKTETIYVQFKEPQDEEVALRIKANVREEFSLSADRIAFGQVRAGVEAAKSVQATLRGDPKWEISEVTSHSEHIKAAAKLLKREGNEVTFEITATLLSTLPAGKWQTEVWLKTNNADVGQVRIPVSIEATAPFSAAPSEVVFGEVKIGESAQKIVLVKGEKPFRIKAVKGADAVVEVGGAGSEAKTVHILKITFKPANVGDVKRTIEIVAGEGDGPGVTISVSGKGGGN